MSKIVSIAPMVGFSNTHFRSFARLLTKRATLYTEMVHMNAVVHNHEKVLPFEEGEHPLVLQLGGNCPDTLFKAAQISLSYGYDSINFNVGCPSQNGKASSFGAVLMKYPDLVKKCLVALREGGKIPVSVKCRLGVDDQDSYQFSRNFISKCANQALISHFIIHARKVYLEGLSPLQNRTIPPLMYPRVVELKKEFPSLTFQINGGIQDINSGFQLISNNNIDGFMVGRLAIDKPFELLKIDRIVEGESHQLSKLQDPTLIRRQILYRYALYLEKLEKNEITDKHGRPLTTPSKMVLFRPILNLYKGELLGNKYRHHLSEKMIFGKQPSSAFVRETAEWITKETLKARQLLTVVQRRRQL